MHLGFASLFQQFSISLRIFTYSQGKQKARDPSNLGFPEHVCSLVYVCGLLFTGLCQKFPKYPIRYFSLMLLGQKKWLPNRYFSSQHLYIPISCTFVCFQKTPSCWSFIHWTCPKLDKTPTVCVKGFNKYPQQINNGKSPETELLERHLPYPICPALVVACFLVFTAMWIWGEEIGTHTS